MHTLLISIIICYDRRTFIYDNRRKEGCFLAIFKKIAIFLLNVSVLKVTALNNKVTVEILIIYEIFEII